MEVIGLLYKEGDDTKKFYFQDDIQRNKNKMRIQAYVLLKGEEEHIAIFLDDKKKRFYERVFKKFEVLAEDEYEDLAVMCLRIYGNVDDVEDDLNAICRTLAQKMPSYMNYAWFITRLRTTFEAVYNEENVFDVDLPFE